MTYLHRSPCNIRSNRRSSGTPCPREQFLTDAGGSVTIIFAMLFLVMLLAVGGAIDVGRWLQAKTQTQAAVDSAVLAATRRLQIEPDNTASAIAAAKGYFQANLGQHIKLINESVSFSVVPGGKGVRANGAAFVATPFLSLVSVDKLPVLNLSGTGYSAALFQQGADSRVKLEISMMLDVTGSMSGQKITDLKAAAKDLVDILVRDGQSGSPVRVGLAPFSEAVRPGVFLNDVRGLGPATSRFLDNNGRWQVYKLSDCVSERDGNAAYTDAAPVGNDKLGPVYTRDGSCQPSSEIVPLTSDRSRLASAIDNLRAGGYTAGHLGTAWAWYILSPNWNSVWPAASQPASYGDGSVKKIAILMTDGEYNLQYDAAGIATRENGNGAMNGLSDAQARQVCDNMKATTIEVYTIGFALKEAKAIETLKRCASTQQNFYLTEDGQQLRDAFRDIALKLSPIYLSQ